MASQTASYDPAAAYEVKEFDVVYRKSPDSDLLARVYQPQGTGPFPAILDVHGGAWSTLSREYMRLANRTLAGSGLVIVVPDFRLAPAHPYPAQVEDVNFAARWLKTHAAEFNASPEGLGGLGRSSGGHTVALSALRPAFPSYVTLSLDDAPDTDATLAYLVLCYPIMDPIARYQFAIESGNEWLASATKGYFSDEAALIQGNPQRVIERREAEVLPPMLILHGTEDQNIPIAVSRRFAETYSTAGGSCQVETFPGAPHGFDGAAGANLDRAVALTKAFISAQLESR